MLLAVGQCTLCSLFPKLTIIPLFHTVYHQKQHVQFPLSKYFKTIKSWAFLGLQGLQIKTSPPKMFISQVKYVSFNVCILTPSYTHRSVCVFVCVVCLSAQDLSSQRSHEMKTTFRRSAPRHLFTSALTSHLIPSSFICHSLFLLLVPSVVHSGFTAVFYLRISGKSEHIFFPPELSNQASAPLDLHSLPLSYGC